MRTWCFAVCAAAVVLSASMAPAAVLFGPAVDAKELIDHPGSSSAIVITIDSRLRDFTDHIEIVINLFSSAILPIKGLGYESYDNSDLSGDAVLTTFYGFDLDPSGTGLALTGFDSATAAGVSFTNERFVGNSGTIYPATALGTFMLSELPALMPGYDLSAFQGDPSSVVYAFRTTVPTSDFAPVPESSTLALAAMGMLSLAVYGWRSRRRAAIA